MGLTLRKDKGSKLSIKELDDNFIYLDNKSATASTPYKVFTALTLQSGDSSKLNLSVGSSFEIGRTYTIASYVAGDNFTNIGATQNATGSVFIATGATPSVWVDNGKNSTSIEYVTGSPVVKILENTLGHVWFEYNTTGQYLLKSNNLFTDSKTTITIGSEGYSGDYNRNINISREDSSSSQIYIEAYNDTTLQDGLLYYTTIEVRVYN